MEPHGALLGSLFDPKWTPNETQAAPKWTPNGLKGRPWWPQRRRTRPKDAPSHLPRHLCECSGLDSGSFWLGFWCSGLDLQGSRLDFIIFARILLLRIAFLAFLRGFWSVLLFLGGHMQPRGRKTKTRALNMQRFPFSMSSQVRKGEFGRG